MKCLEDLQRKIKGSHTDVVNSFWEGYDRKKRKFIYHTPLPEEECRNRIIENLEKSLHKFNISAERETTVGDNKRCDILCKHLLKDLPIEIKGQWHNELWVALNEQVPLYTKGYYTEGYGIYLVLWFGKNVEKYQPIKYNEKNIESFEDMEHSLFNEAYVHKDEKIKIFVLNLEKS